MTTTAHEDQYAPEPVSGDPVFETRAELRVWTDIQLGYREPGRKALRETQDRIRRVTLAHLHLREGKG